MNSDEKHKTTSPLSTVLFLIIFLDRSVFAENISCFNHLEYLFSPTSFAKLDLVILMNGGGGNCTEIEQHFQGGIPSLNFKGISIIWTRHRNATILANSSLNTGTGPVVFAFLGSNEVQIIAALREIADFELRNRRGKLWNPIFVFHSQLQWIQANSTFVPLLIKLSLQSHVYVLHSLTNSSGAPIVVQEIYSIRNTTVKSEKIVQRNEVLNYCVFNTYRRSNFRQGRVIAIAMDEPDYPLSTKFKPNSSELVSGFEVEVFRYFRDSLNFSVQVLKGIGWVRDGPNQTLTGYALQLNQELGDIAIGAGEFLESRVKGPDGITYIHPTFSAHVMAFFKQPPPSSIRNVFTQAFTKEVWMCLLIVWIMILITLNLIVFLRRKIRLSNATDNLIAKDSMIWAIGAICQQGYYTSPRSSSVKIIFICGILTGLISYVAYSATLVSMLSVEVVPIKEFADLLSEKFYLSSDERIPTATVFVKDLENKNRIPDLKGARNMEVAKGFETIRNSRFALVTIADSFYPVIRRLNYSDQYICSLVSRKVVTPRQLKSSCFVKRGSPLREFFNYKLLVMQERGVKRRLLQHYTLGTTLTCLEDASGSFQLSFGLVDIFTPFFILLVGISLSFPIVFVEKFCSTTNFENFTKTHQLNAFPRNHTTPTNLSEILE